MNSTQYLIILITAVVCFCIYVVAEIVRLRRRDKTGIDEIVRMTLKNRARSNHTVRNQQLIDRLQLQEEIRNRLEGGDGA